MTTQRKNLTDLETIFFLREEELRAPKPDPELLEALDENERRLRAGQPLAQGEAEFLESWRNGWSQ